VQRFIGVVFSPEAEAQLETLNDSDIRYQLEVEEFDWILRREPEKHSTPTVIDGVPVYIFITAPKPNGLPRLAVSYILIPDERLIKVIDMRPFARFLPSK
jgi:hypothetical protein